MNIHLGNPLPQGVTVLNNNCVNFAIEATPNAECVLVLFSKGKKNEPLEIQMNENTYMKGIFHLTLKEFEYENYEYQYKIDGENYLDPYTTQVVGRQKWGSSNCNDLRGEIHSVNTAWEDTYPLLIPDEEVIAYRLHVRGFTKHSSSKVKYRGTLQGIVEKIPYLKELGVNQIHLLPLHEFIEEGKLLNYWGYTKGFYFSPKSSYCQSKDTVEELRKFIRLMHANGIEVILDMYFDDACTLEFQLQCLRYYALQFHVDGFILSYHYEHLMVIKKDYILKNLKIIVLNDEFQITARKFLKGDEGVVPDFMWKLRNKSLREGVLHYNYITSTNGFTLHDLISYDGKKNEQNGEKNQDGPVYNYSWNCGAEGKTRKKTVLELRKRQARNAFLLLLLSQGTPCLLSGDEILNTQNGNNNAYCQDNATSWLNWENLVKEKDTFEYVKKIIDFRKKHPIFRQKELLQGIERSAKGLPDISFHGDEAWQVKNDVSSRQLGVLYSKRNLDDFDCYVAYNMHWIEHDFALPIPSAGKSWYLVLDTSKGDMREEVLISKRKIEIEARSICVFFAK